MVAIIDMADVTAFQRLHQPADRAGLRWRHQQVDVVGHQDTGVDGDIGLRRERPQVGEVPELVVSGEEARLAIVAALDHVLGDSREIDAGLAGHGAGPDRTRPKPALIADCRRSESFSSVPRKTPL